MKLLIDLGNSRLKYGLWDGRVLHRGSTLAHAESAGTGEVDFASLWKDIQNPSVIWIASVASTALEQSLHRSLAAHFSVPIRSARSPAMACGVRNAYSAPARLGVDRFLGLVAVHALEPGATVVASCGTALTLDAIGIDGVHLGGLIAPAPALMRSALLDNTARLGDLQPTVQVVDFADTTALAVESGTWLAATALVERFLTRASIALGMPAQLVISGGGAKRLGSLLDVAHRIEPDLVLRGLAQFADAGAA